MLLLEAGPDFPDPEQLPDPLQYGWGAINLAARQAGAPSNWSLEGTAHAPQPRPLPVPRGKVTGRTSAINGQTFNGGVYLAVGAGELWLTSAAPTVPPAMVYRSLDDPWDVQRLRDAGRLGVRLLEAPACQARRAQRVSPTEADLASDAALDHWLRHNVTSAYHLAGTCKMGPASDPMAGVDQWCHVHGLAGVRVADASIVPDVIRAHTKVTTMMIAERCADVIKAGQ